MGFDIAGAVIYSSALVLGRVVGDKNVISANNRKNERRRWILLLVFILLCVAASSISGYVGGYTSYVVFGIAIWLIVAIGVKASMDLRKRKSKAA